MFDTIPGTLMCQIHKFSHFLQRVHCVEVKSAVDVEMFTALPDSASSLFTATQTANGHDLPRLFHGKEPGTDCLRMLHSLVPSHICPTFVGRQDIFPHTSVT